MLLVSVLTLCSALPVLVWAVSSGRSPAHADVAGNIALGLPAPERASTSGGSTVTPSADEHGSLAGALVRRLTTAKGAARAQRLVAGAGHPEAWPLQRVLAAKILAVLGVGSLALLYALDAPSAGRVLGAATVTAVAYVAPELLLHSQAQKRQQAITEALADTLDQMTISVEAGLAFDTAMARAAKNGTGPLAEEFVRTLQDVQVGVSRRAAFRALADRTSAEDLRRFVTSLLQADAYGIPLADVLRTQAVEMRRKRRQRAEEKAMQIPVKVVFPLILCILPALFIVLLGPAALDIARAFG